MKKRLWGTALLLMCFGVAAVALAQIAQDIQKYPSCAYCGMDREQFAFSRFLIEYDDGSSFGACSLHCAAVDLAMNMDKTPKSLKVGDLATKELIDAETAVWVLGGNKPGVMSKRAKWAFAKKEDAEKFVKEDGGEVCTFDRAMRATYEDMYADTKMIREKRKMKRMKGQTEDPNRHEHGHKHEHPPKQ